MIEILSFLRGNALVSARPLPKAPARRRDGFTLIELTVVVLVMSVMVSLVMPSTSNALGHVRINRGTAVVAMDLRLAASLASRQRHPVRVAYNSGITSYTFTDVATGALLHSRDLGEFDLHTVTFAPQTIDIAPSGIASNSLTVTLSTSSYERKVTMMRAGMVRVAAQ